MLSGEDGRPELIPWSPYRPWRGSRGGRTEGDINYKKRFAFNSSPELCNVTDAISHATCAAAHDLNAEAVITVTKSGMTARMISKFRPMVPIIGLPSPSEKVVRQMNLSWGITPLFVEEKQSTDELFASAVDAAVKNGLLKDGEPYGNHCGSAARKIRHHEHDTRTHCRRTHVTLAVKPLTASAALPFCGRCLFFC